MVLTFVSGCDFLFDESQSSTSSNQSETINQSQTESESIVTLVTVLKPESSLKGEQYTEVVEELQTWGFVNVESVPVYDIIWGITKPGTTKSVSIDGSTSYKKNDTFERDVPVVVTYSMPYDDDPARKKYEITWKNYDGTTLKTENLLVGTMPSYTGKEPTKPATKELKFIFNGWSPTIVAVTENKTYTATYREEINTYVITWKNYNGDVLETDAAVEYGVIPTYDGLTPTKPTDEINIYEFEKWSPEVYAADKNQTYTAQFKATPIEFAKETAKKVVHVALTNYYSEDVFDDTGNYIDRTKFHNYSYSGPYKLTLVSEGTWKYLGEDTWQVSNMRFRSWVSASTYYDVYGKVTFTGEYYMVTDADNGMASNPSRHIIYELNYEYRVTQEMIDN